MNGDNLCGTFLLAVGNHRRYRARRAAGGQPREMARLPGFQHSLIAMEDDPGCRQFRGKTVVARVDF